MKRYLIFSFLVMFLMTALTVDVEAQYSRKRKKKKSTTERKNDYFDESGGSLKDKLWYGADVNLNFGSFNEQSAFTYGIGPMVGYMISDDFSIGPRIAFTNSISKFIDGGERTFNAKNFGGGIFARHRFLQNYFVHAEYSILSEEFATQDMFGLIYDANGKTINQRVTGNHYYLGLGYGGGSNGSLGFTTYALWDFSQEFTSNNIPIDIRFGITYNF